MPMDFDRNDFLESASDLSKQEPAEGGLPQWIRDNLENRQSTETAGLPQWIRDNLAGKEATSDVSQQSERKLESTPLFGGVVREFFRKPAMEEKEGAADRYRIDEATKVWHLQEGPRTCTTSCQEFIIDEFKGTDMAESVLNEYARERGWINEDGTSIEDVGNLLEAAGIETHRYMDATYQDMKNALNDGNRVIVGVYAAALTDEWGGTQPVLTADHNIEVLGVDESDPENVKVIVNDPGVSDGCGKEIPLDVFNNARAGSGGFMVVAVRP